MELTKKEDAIERLEKNLAEYAKVDDITDYDIDLLMDANQSMIGLQDVMEEVESYSTITPYFDYIRKNGDGEVILKIIYQLAYDEE